MNQRLQAVMEIPCAWHVVTQKRETVLFGAGDGGGWSLGADSWPGGAGKGLVIKRPGFRVCSGPGWEVGGEELPGCQTWLCYSVSMDSDR